MRDWYEHAAAYTSEQLGGPWPVKPVAAVEAGPIVPPQRHVLDKMATEGWSVEMRERVIRSSIDSQALSGLTMPLDIATRVFDEVIFEPLPDIGQT